jgi:hypothetical protein
MAIKSAGQWRDFWRWAVLLPIVTGLIFICSLTAHVGLGYPLPGEIRSNLHATYAPWERIVIPPVSTAIIQDLPEWQGRPPEELTEPGNVWTDPTVILPVVVEPLPTSTEAAIAQALTPTGTSLPSSFATATPRPSPTPTLSSWLATATRTLTPTLPAYFTPSITRTSTPSLTLTRTLVPAYTPTPTTQFIPTATYTSPPPFTQTPTLHPTVTPTSTTIFTPTPATIFTPTFTLTPIFTPTSTTSLTPTITPTPYPTEPPCGGNIPAGEPDIGPPDGSFASLPCGGLLILDLPLLGHSPIDLSVPDLAYDLVFYERRLPPPDSQVIELDWVSVEIGPGPSGACDTSAWYTSFNWGDGVVINNGHLGNLYPEIDNQTIPLSALWGTLPLQTGIAIDLDSAALGIPPGIYPCIRIISPFNFPDNDPSEVDALEILQ